MVTTVTVISANIRGLPEQDYFAVRNRIRQAISLAGREGVTFLQECDPDNVTKSRLKSRRQSYSTVVLKEAQRYDKEVYGRSTETPIVIDTAKWKVTKWRIKPVTPGRKHVSPSRFLVMVWATNRRTGARFLFINCHPVSKGHYSRSTRGISFLGWRIEMLDRYMKSIKTEVVAAYKDKRHTIYGGDMNDPTPARTSSKQVALYNHGLDHLYAVPAPGTKVSRIKRVSRPKNKAMDHPLIGATTTFTTERKAA